MGGYFSSFRRKGFQMSKKHRNGNGKPAQLPRAMDLNDKFTDAAVAVRVRVGSMIGNPPALRYMTAGEMLSIESQLQKFDGRLDTQVLARCLGTSQFRRTLQTMCYGGADNGLSPVFAGEREPDIEPLGWFSCL
jgi:hypothetical protein